MILNKRKVFLAFSLFILFHLSNIAIAKAISTTSEVIVIGDVHGAYKEVTELLSSLKVIDDKLNWQAGSKHLVSLGDLVDRGKDSRKVIELIMQLKRQALTAGGDVHLVLGNHEVMLMTGDFRYVSKIEFAAFKAEETPEERKKLFEQYKNFNSKGNQESFEQTFPIGFIGLFKAYQADGKIGKWLRKNGNAVLKVNNSLFVHGGISDQTVNSSLSEINNEFTDNLNAHDTALQQLTKNGLLPFTLKNYRGVNIVNDTYLALEQETGTWKKSAEQFLSLQDSILFRSSGPFWYRGNAYCPELSESYILEDAQSVYGVERIVIGHSVKYGQLISRINGQVILADTGMLTEYYNGTPSAVIIKDNKVIAHHLNPAIGKKILNESQKFRGNPRGMSDNDVEAFLASAKVINSERLSVGITKSHKITLEKDGVTLHALFKTFNNSSFDSYKHEVAAYKLDRLLKQYLVPPAILRKIDDKSGMVQLWIENVITENDRLDKKIEYSGICEVKSNLRLRLVFDTLIMNLDRNNGNLLWDEEFYLTFIDHSNAFGRGKKFPRMYKGSKVNLSNYYLTILKNLNSEMLNKTLKGVLSPGQVSALLSRRDFLIREHNRHNKNKS